MNGAFVKRAEKIHLHENSEKKIAEPYNEFELDPFAAIVWIGKLVSVDASNH